MKLNILTIIYMLYRYIFFSSASQAIKKHKVKYIAWLCCKLYCCSSNTNKAVCICYGVYCNARTHIDVCILWLNNELSSWDPGIDTCVRELGKPGSRLMPVAWRCFVFAEQMLIYHQLNAATFNPRHLHRQASRHQPLKWGLNIHI